MAEKDWYVSRRTGKVHYGRASVNGNFLRFVCRPTQYARMSDYEAVNGRFDSAECCQTCRRFEEREVENAWKKPDACR